MASQGRYRIAFNKTASGNLVAGVTGGRIQLYGLSLLASASFTISINDGSGGTALWGPVDIQAGGGAWPQEGEFPLLEATTKGNALYLTLTGTGNVGGHISCAVEGL